MTDDDSAFAFPGAPGPDPVGALAAWLAPRFAAWGAVAVERVRAATAQHGVIFYEFRDARCTVG